MREMPLRERVLSIGHALSLFLLLNYLLCVGFGLLAPESLRMFEAWAPLLPGFEWLTPLGFTAGAIGAYGYGWYIAALFVPLKAWAENRRRP
ncbi:hypothetical protein KUV67_06345 [Halomonas denitrificans]|nr:hypothetical protein [Halomonas denitrificans]